MGSTYHTPPPSDITFTKRLNFMNNTNNSRQRWSSAPQSPPRNTRSTNDMEVDSDETLSPEKHQQTSSTVFGAKSSIYNSFNPTTNSTSIFTSQMNKTSPNHSQLSYLTAQNNFKNKNNHSPGEATITPFDSVSQINSHEPYKMNNTPKYQNTPQKHYQTSNSLISQQSSLRKRNTTSPISPTNTQITNFSRVRNQKYQNFSPTSGVPSQSSRFTTQTMMEKEMKWRNMAALCVLFAIVNAVTIYTLIKYFNN